jgi:hypothetical protein
MALFFDFDVEDLIVTPCGSRGVEPWPAAPCIRAARAVIVTRRYEARSVAGDDVEGVVAVARVKLAARGHRWLVAARAGEANPIRATLASALARLPSAPSCLMASSSY